MNNEEIRMRKSRFTKVQIMGVLRQVEGDFALADVCREHAIGSATFYKKASVVWLAKNPHPPVGHLLPFASKREKAHPIVAFSRS
jgi:hypothetical protein